MATKNKKSEEIEAKKRHRLQLPKHGTLSLERNVQSRVEKETFLIVCEGKNTEPTYFRQFKLTTATIYPVGEGYNTISLVKRAKELSEKTYYDQVWCVFDADPKFDNPNQMPNFNKALELAEKYGFRVAYSNQAFEYWIILHFLDHQGGSMDRSRYNNEINRLLPNKVIYDGNGSKIITPEIFDLLEGIDDTTGKIRRNLAINRARRNYNHKLENGNPTEESSTTVFMLVEVLMKYI